MLPPPLKNLFLLFSALFLFGGCAPKPVAVETPDLASAQRKLQAICRDELKAPIVSSVIENTLFIYLPMREDIIEIKASGDGVSSSKTSSIKPSVNYLQIDYHESRFIIEYDIGTAESYAKDYGYTNAYSERFQTIQQGLLSAVNRSFYNVRDHKIDFVQFTVADINNGIESENIVYMDDLKKALSPLQTLPQDEFIKRYVSELHGNTKAINDLDGTHLSLHPISLPEFLAKQMMGRINFKYQRSNFPPGTNAQDEILAQVNETLRVYSFKDYSEIVLADLRTGNDMRLKNPQ